MIRINLLPQAKKATRAAAPVTPGNTQAWAIGYAVAAFVWVAALLGIYLLYDAELEEEQATNAALQTQIDQLRSKSAQLEEVQARLAESRRLEEVVNELHRERTGPTRVLMELSQILSPPPGGGPTIDPEALEELRRDNPLAGFNRSWDPRRLWINTFTETDGNCEINGLGRTNEDVAEFLRRLALSDLFTNVTLTKTQSRRVQDLGLTLISFELTCQVSY
jgi:type IV pilus assembly protein PilN